MSPFLAERQATAKGQHVWAGLASMPHCLRRSHAKGRQL
jgi:hypothetical protein